MNGMQSVDANLLLALDALLHEGSVTAAARRMNVTAPAMSHTLARLRATLGDRSATLKGSLILAVAMTVFSVLLFSYVLHVPFPPLRWVPSW